jgi:hypothetical protein
MPAFAPTSSVPISSLPESTLGHVETAVTVIVEARFDNLIADIGSKLNNQIVVAVEITAVTRG